MAYTRTMNGKVPQVLQELHFDETPTPGSLNPVTSDGVAEAISAAEEKLERDIEDAVSEVTLDPSAVALGNTHLLDVLTELPSDGTFLVDSATDGPGQMPKDTLLDITSKKALAGNVAQAFDPTRDEDHKYLVNEFTIYNGKLYRFDVSHYGAWNASHAHLVDEAEFLQSFGSNSVAVKDFYPTATKAYYIKMDYSVGDTVPFTYTSAGGRACIVLSCKKGDVFRIEGTGGSAPRLWGFVDSNDKLVAVADANKTEAGVEHIAPCDGKFVFNTSTSGTTPYCKKVVPLQKIYSDYQETTYKKDLFADNAQVSKYITTNVSVGDVVNLTPVSNTSFSCLVLDCAEGDEFFIRGEGGSASRLWCFIDSSNKAVSVAGAGESTGSSGKKLVAPCAGKLIFNTLKSYSGGTPYCMIYAPIGQFVETNFEKIYNALGVLEKHDIPNDPTPFEQLGTLLADLDLSLDTRMEQIYDLFDDLVTDHPSLITKYDAASLVDLSYPRYANGVSAGDLDYLETPAYKTYIYKISSVNEAAGNLSAFPKKKLLIVGAVHGNEYFASVNCYSLAAHLLKNISSDLFSILALFDIWIMPCTNGYGIIHPQRPNANNVDINRNFGTSKWEESGSVDFGTWSGSTSDSEFEVQLIEGLKEYIQPNFFVDHHCSPGHTEAQFYSESPSENVLARSYDSLVQISEFFIKNFSTYFGTSYHLFRDSVYAAALPYGTTKQQGHSDLWFYEQGIEAATVEVFGYINYTDGAYDASGHRGNDLWMVSEYTLRNQLAKYLPIVLE